LAGLKGAELRWHNHSTPIAKPMTKDGPPPPPPSPNQTRERERHFPEAVVPTWEEVKRMAEMECILPTVARDFFEHYDSKNLWANKHGTPVNVLGCLLVWNNNQKKINANPNRNQPGGRANPRLAGQSDDVATKTASVAAAIAACES
jgi:hypothetical protein